MLQPYNMQKEPERINANSACVWLRIVESKSTRLPANHTHTHTERFYDLIAQRTRIVYAIFVIYAISSFIPYGLITTIEVRLERRIAVHIDK